MDKIQHHIFRKKQDGSQIKKRCVWSPRSFQPYSFLMEIAATLHLYNHCHIYNTTLNLYFRAASWVKTQSFYSRYKWQAVQKNWTSTQRLWKILTRWILRIQIYRWCQILKSCLLKDNSCTVLHTHTCGKEVTLRTQQHLFLWWSESLTFFFPEEVWRDTCLINVCQNVDMVAYWCNS